MGRFHSYTEVMGKDLPPIEDLQWIAGQIARTEPFREGSAVLCGSICWGVYSWRSDIDIAHFSTLQYPNIDAVVQQVLDGYAERTQGQFIVPRFDVITVGADSLALVAGAPSVSTPPISLGVTDGNAPVSSVFTETAVLFGDHIGSLAALKGDPWRAFVARHLSGVAGDPPGRREAIERYVGAMTTEWERRPLHRLNLGPNGELGSTHLDLMARSENYPVNLMRRILGVASYYPRPDRASDVQDAFVALDRTWSKHLWEHFQPFSTIAPRYEQLVAKCKSSGAPLGGPAYYAELREIFSGLPFAKIQEAVWEYLRS